MLAPRRYWAMPRARFRRGSLAVSLTAGILAMGVLLAACGATGASLQPSATPAGSVGPAGDLMRPEHCSTTLFYTPSGEVLDLSGRWAAIAAGEPVPTPAPITDGTGVLIRQSGDCVWAVDQHYQGSGANLRRNVFVWYGRLTNDLRIDGVHIFVSNDDPADMYASGFTIRVGFSEDGDAFLCDGGDPNCPDAVVAGDWIEVRVDR